MTAAARIWTDTPAFAALAAFAALSALPLAAALALDARSLNGEAVWLKPLKFHAALAIYLATLALYARWLPPGLTATRRWRAFELAVCVAVAGELLWVGGAAALGVGSHFNLSSPAWIALYALMGAFAVLLTSASLVMGVALLRHRNSGLSPALHLAVALGLVLTFPLTLVAAGEMASSLSRHVGTPVTGAALPVLGWSREVGDLRVPHFFATHALHALPLAGLAALALPARAQVPAVWAAALAYAAFVLAVFAQALSGRPFL